MSMFGCMRCCLFWMGPKLESVAFFIFTFLLVVASRTLRGSRKASRLSSGAPLGLLLLND